MQAGFIASCSQPARKPRARRRRVQGTPPLVSTCTFVPVKQVKLDLLVSLEPDVAAFKARSRREILSVPLFEFERQIQNFADCVGYDDCLLVQQAPVALRLS